ncbi:MAG: 30S ribosomal protein S21 [Planctomycetales bacterium]|nr:30S ribosomal protein S21 [Planctomycetales bacterium]
MCEKEGISKELKRVSYYEKPSEAKRRKQRQNWKKALQARLKALNKLRGKKKGRKKRKGGRGRGP